MATARTAPRTFPSRERFQLALGDVYDGYGSADLAVWLPAPSGPLHLSGSVPDAPARIVAAWPSGSKVESGWVLPNEFRLWLDHEASHAGAVVELANTENPEVRAATATLGYSPELPGQVTGYWFEEPDVPARKPPYDPNGALPFLPPLTGNGGALRAVDLVLIGYEWRVLSHAAALTYLHTTGIRRGERWILATYGDDGTLHRRFLVEAMQELPVAEVARLGDQVVDRARDDQPAVLFEISES